MWVQQDQSAYTNFLQTFDKVHFLPFIIRDDFKHPQYKNPLHIHIPYFDIITSNNDFIVELSETSDNRPYITTSTNEIQITPDIIFKFKIKMNFSLIHLNHKFNTHNKVHK